MNRFRKKLVNLESVESVASLISFLDCEVGYHSIAESILRFFNALPDTLIPSILFQECLAASRTPEATIKVPELTYALFKYNLGFERVTGNEFHGIRILFEICP